LDKIWMQIKYHIQIVHDIEYGYGDPLRIKVIPDYSLRFVDNEYEKSNQKIASIQNDMVEYFDSRKTDLSKRGIFA